MFISFGSFANWNIQNYGTWTYYVSSDQSKADQICKAKGSEQLAIAKSQHPDLILRVRPFTSSSCPARKYASIGTWTIESWSSDTCPEGDGIYYPEGSHCSPNPSPDPHSCPEAGTFVDKTWGREGLNGWSTCRSDNCVVAAQVDNHSSMPSGVCYVNDSGKRICRYDLFYTGQACTYNPDGGTGINPPDHEYPTDPVKPPNPDPTPDPDDPNLSDGDNAVVGELSEANQRLENIDHTLQDLTNTTKSDNDALIEYQSHLLGEMKQMNQQLADGVGSGGGGGGGNGDGNGEGSCEGEDCNPVGFPGAPEVVDPFAEILDETDINDILTRTEEVKTQLQTQMNNFKGLFRVPDYGTGGDIAPVEFDLKHAGTTIPVKFGIFSQISADISSIIVMIAAFIAFLIVTTRR
ncbi:hypothetical protein [Vibrio antiquarius]|uniref:hypothetical protein n=1 Tax=Vibrio antiquarius (strain Ex25) TaxID=150340 RepID=UPI002657C072|nr:hypothetical protein [Vibrio antiquarius]MCE9846364.1 hypothetical protein [Vibrio antiquarius]